VDVTPTKTRIFLPEFLALSRDDLQLIAGGLAAKKAKQLKLGGGRVAECTAKSCIVRDPQGSRIPVTSRDVATFLALQQKAAKTGADATRVEGPVTARCTSTDCVADLLIETTGPVKVQGNVKLEPEPELDVAGSLLQGFVRGLVGSGSPR
jgi:hypothetical protein